MFGSAVPCLVRDLRSAGGVEADNWDPHYILTEALRWHVSSLNVKSTCDPARVEQDSTISRSKMGYRFALRRIEFEVA